MKRINAALVAAALAACVSPATAVGSSEPLTIDWTKTEAGCPSSVFTGTATGDVSGPLTARRIGDIAFTGSTLHFVFDYVIGSAFEATVRGIFNPDTGVAVVNGTVTGGRLSGARVHGRANVIGQTACGGLVLAGRFRVMPASAG
jgi:hypothetical protein